MHTSYNAESNQSRFALSLSLLLPVVILIATTATAQTTPTTGILPFEVCQVYDPVSTHLQSVLTYDSLLQKTVTYEPGTLDNYFSPGEPDLGQPEAFYPGTDQDVFAAGFYTSDSDFLVWVLGGVKTITSVGSAPPCSPAYFQSAATLNYTAPGTYTNQLLGSIAMPPTTMVSTAYATASGSNISVANLNWTANGIQPGTDIQPYQYLYGDVTVSSGPASSTGLLITVNDAAARQLALGTDTITFSGVAASSAGCATDVTSSVQGTIGHAIQLFGTQIWTQTVTIKNTSGTAIFGPIQLVLNNLSSNARLFTAAGTASCPGTSGSPYITITNGLAANAYGAVVLVFTNSTIPNSGITYTPKIVAAGTRL